MNEEVTGFPATRRALSRLPSERHMLNWAIYLALCCGHQSDFDISCSHQPYFDGIQFANPWNPGRQTATIEGLSGACGGF